MCRQQARRGACRACARAQLLALCHLTIFRRNNFSGENFHPGVSPISAIKKRPRPRRPGAPSVSPTANNCCVHQIAEHSIFWQAYIRYGRRECARGDDPSYSLTSTVAELYTRPLSIAPDPGSRSSRARKEGQERESYSYKRHNRYVSVRRGQVDR